MITVPPVADVNGDRIVNAQGIELITSSWLHTDADVGGGIASVPEPCALVLAARGGFALLAYRRQLE